MQKKLKRKDRGRGRGNKGSDGFHEVCGIKVEFLMQLFQMTGHLVLTEDYLKVRGFSLFVLVSRKVSFPLKEFSCT